MTAGILAATAGMKGQLTNPNEGSDLQGLNSNSDYLQGVLMLLYPSDLTLSLPLSLPFSLSLFLPLFLHH